jgi:DNA-binding transcriptional LysR family regulator
MTTETAVQHADQLLFGIDLLVMPHGFVTDLRHRDLYRDEWMCVVSTDNDQVGDQLTVAHLESLPWVASYHGPTASTPAARFMRMLGIEPRIQVVVDGFLAVPDLVAGSDRIALLQRRLVDRLPASAGVRALPCPFEPGPLVQAMWWHPVYDEDPEHAYLRNVVTRATAPLQQPRTGASGSQHGLDPAPTAAGGDARSASALG